MELVAKEYVAALDPETSGVPICWKFAGAAAELTGALIGDSQKFDTVAAALKRANRRADEASAPRGRKIQVLRIFR